MIIYAVPSAPVEPQAGDWFVPVRDVIEQWRNVGGHPRRVACHPVQWRPLEGDMAVGNQSLLGTFFRERRMPGVNVSMVNLVENQTTGVVIASWSDGSSNEYASWSAIGDVADAIDADTELGKRILISRAHRLSPGGEHKTSQVGAQVSCNLIAAEPIAYTPAE